MTRDGLIPLGPVTVSTRTVPVIRTPMAEPNAKAIGAAILAMTRGEISPAQGQVKLIAAGLPANRARELAACAANNLKTRVP